ncbi:MAG: ornithine carbamoyltransferase [Actinomycetota bacterium]|nr:ornithine carbamoyltransferase [Actinomycetota bacterium]
MTAHLLEIADLSTGDVRTVLDVATAAPERLGQPLARTGVALLFEKPSTRTRHSMEMAVVQLGGHPVYTRGDEVGFDVRESVEDVTRILQGYHGMLAARVFDHGVLERMVQVADVPVVNMLSDRAHPLQALADALTMEQAIGPLNGRTVAWVGDYNNVARSLAEVCVLLGAHVRLACPVGYDADPSELERLALLGTGDVLQSHRPAEAVQGADAVHADTWVSMGQEDDEEARKQAFEGFTVDDALMAGAAPSAVFMHCLPAHRGLEVAPNVIDGPRSVVFRQGHNRLHSARAALAWLAGVRP